VPVTVQQVRKIHESNQQYRTREEWAAVRDAIIAEQEELSARRTKAERAAAREAKKMQLAQSLRPIDRRRAFRTRAKRHTGRHCPSGQRGRTPRKDHKPLLAA
jgi:hypothetical protein